MHWHRRDRDGGRVDWDVSYWRRQRIRKISQRAEQKIVRHNGISSFATRAMEPSNSNKMSDISSWDIFRFSGFLTYSGMAGLVIPAMRHGVFDVPIKRGSRVWIALAAGSIAVGTTGVIATTGYNFLTGRTY